MSARAVRELTRAALDPDGPGRVADLTRVVARLTGSRGAVLWEAPGELRGVPRLSVLALWLDGSSPEAPNRAVGADLVSERAFRTWSLALAGDVGTGFAESFGQPVTAALPVEYVDGCRGVLTLLGDGELAPEAFDTAVELVEILPELCSVVRERQTLQLVNACNSFLHEADIGSRAVPLTDDELGKHLSEVCTYVARTLQCTEVTIHLRRALTPEGVYELIGSSTGLGGGPRPTTTDRPFDHVRSAVGDEPRMEVRLVSGKKIEGMLRCRGADGPPYHFTTSDLALLRPIAAQVSRYWRVWNHRRTISGENESWRRLAAGMTSFNRLVAEGLDSADGDPQHEQRVAELAVRILQEVVPEAAGSTAYRATADGADAGPLAAVAHDGAAYRSVPVDDGGLAARALRSRTQLGSTDPVLLLTDGVAEAGWQLCTPIRVGEQVYGVLEAVGPEATQPDNSAQVHEIIGDQLGLYRHLQDTLGNLHRARTELETALRAEAEAMEDLKHQLVSPLRTATDRTELVLRSGRFDTRAEGQLKAIRGLCRKASRVAMSAGVFATLSRGGLPEPKPERIGVDDLLRVLITSADDAQVLGNPRRGITFDVERDTVRGLGRRLVDVDASFLQQCVGNLLDNASKYAYEGTRVRIGAQINATRLALEVASVGLPLAQPDVTRCLGRNWRGDAARAATGEGSGIGLWIVDNLMRSMRGRVVVDAARENTTVRLIFPLA